MVYPIISMFPNLWINQQNKEKNITRDYFSNALKFFPSSNSHQFTGNMIQNENFNYSVEENFNFYCITYNRRKSLEWHFHEYSLFFVWQFRYTIVHTPPVLVCPLSKLQICSCHHFIHYQDIRTWNRTGKRKC